MPRWLEALAWTRSSFFFRPKRWGCLRIFYCEEHFSRLILSACPDTLPFGKRESYPRQQSNNWLHSFSANKEKGQKGKAPATPPVETHLGAQQIPLQTLTSHHYKLFGSDNKRFPICPNLVCRARGFVLVTWHRRFIRPQAGVWICWSFKKDHWLVNLLQGQQQQVAANKSRQRAPNQV